MIEFLRRAAVLWRFSDYRPSPVTLRAIANWLSQFDKKDRKHITRLLEKIIYFSERRVRTILVEQNNALMKRLLDAGLKPNQIIYVSVHDAGSSSAVMLSMLRDAAGLEQRGCRFLDSNDALGINRYTNELGEGAIVYVDDFVGSGTQFCGARDNAGQNIVGSFSEFLLVPCICEEAMYRLGERGSRYHWVVPLGSTIK